MFQNVQTAPPDSILGLNEAFRNDPNPEKINLSVGVFKDANGVTPVLDCVKEAERRLVSDEKTKSYLPIDGRPEYCRLVRELMLGADHEINAASRGVTVQTPGGTGALRVAADFLAKNLPGRRVWISQPTWPNHPSIFAAAGIETVGYPYFDKASNGLAFGEMMEALEKVPSGDVVLLHGCCHNPSGIDPTPEQWKEIAELIHRRDLLPLVDFAYQGFGDGLCEDAAGLAALAQPGQELLVCSSFSKNFGLYNERVGALTAVAGDSAAATAVLSQLKNAIRANYSNPPTHGGAVVETILSDATLKSQWEGELTAMRDRINGMRTLLVETMKKVGVDRDFSFIANQKGMFSFSGLNPVQVDELRSKFAIYIVGSGRINVAGISETNVEKLCNAIKAVL
ncbi:aspartate/tyrosine/aromatic aminotransferase [Blastopirellula sp. JC732]|uniref:Aminotransferase n=1 Tax=Blastopirellula sediminis TaxID=2894196 RepID=A0A9X1MRG6_9BACT|nr:amino acid aminotransferase [Blastopirellula sediminis]MCC9606019.1 aspartate/tyrosine/aromatic aminotransferase [Blastopirellula sediminis]MCC9630682.1 aspartate/tyrosine/aromatic aminotransferase [Blastopirellula sediminis]